MAIEIDLCDELGHVIESPMRLDGIPRKKEYIKKDNEYRVVIRIVHLPDLGTTEVWSRKFAMPKKDGIQVE